jgi:hypothetical protein
LSYIDYHDDMKHRKKKKNSTLINDLWFVFQSYTVWPHRTLFFSWVWTLVEKVTLKKAQFHTAVLIQLINRHACYNNNNLLYVIAGWQLISWCGPAFTPHALLTTFEYSLHTTHYSPVDFCGGRKTGGPGEKPSKYRREPTKNSTHISPEPDNRTRTTAVRGNALTAHATHACYRLRWRKWSIDL